jgi:molecular chaperone GrpE
MSKKTQFEVQEDEHTPPESQSETTEHTPETGPGTEEASVESAEEGATKLESAEKEARDYYDRLLRVSADFDNYRKRTAREMREIVKYANEELIKDLLSVVDNLERALEVATLESHSDEPVLKGVTLTLAEIQKLLERQAVKPIEALGKDFDPNFHQAMMQEASEEHPPNTVIREFQKGYLIHERLLRPAMVAVSTTGRTQADSSET